MGPAIGAPKLKNAILGKYKMANSEKRRKKFRRQKIQSHGFRMPCATIVCLRPEPGIHPRAKKMTFRVLGLKGAEKN